MRKSVTSNNNTSIKSPYLNLQKPANPSTKASFVKTIKAQSQKVKKVPSSTKNNAPLQISSFTPLIKQTSSSKLPVPSPSGQTKNSFLNRTAKTIINKTKSLNTSSTMKE